jgi:6-phosphogluconolactonase
VVDTVISSAAEARENLAVFPTEAQCAGYLSQRFWELQAAATQAGRPFAVALSGGKTPARLYRELTRGGSKDTWERIHVFFVDERIVPLTDSQSNYLMVKRNLLRAIPIPAANVHPVETQRFYPHVCARRYEEMMVRFFAAESQSIPAFDFVLLGLGEDGHTASLFPDSSALDDRTRLVTAVPPVEGRLGRVTLTFNAINRARHIFFLVTGKAKADIVRRLLVVRDPSLPASRVIPLEGSLTFVCDRLAAELLDNHQVEEAS